MVREDWVNFSGEFYSVKDSNLYTKPNYPIPIYIAGLGMAISSISR